MVITTIVTCDMCKREIESWYGCTKGYSGTEKLLCKECYQKVDEYIDQYDINGFGT